MSTATLTTPTKPRHKLVYLESDASLCTRLQAGDATAATTLIERYGHIALYHAQKLAFGATEEVEDLTQVGLFAIAKEAKRFDPTKASFATFVSSKIRFAILDEVRLVEHLQGNTRLMRARGLRLRKRRSLFDQISSKKSKLDSKPYTFADRLESQQENHAVTIERIDWIRMHLKGFSKKQRLVLVYYYGLEGEPELTLRQIADKLNLCESRVSQIHSQSLARLTENMAGRSCYEES